MVTMVHTRSALGAKKDLRCLRNHSRCCRQLWMRLTCETGQDEDVKQVWTFGLHLLRVVLSPTSWMENHQPRGWFGCLVGSWQFFNYLQKKIAFQSKCLFCTRASLFISVCLSLSLWLPLVITAVNTVIHFTCFCLNRKNACGGCDGFAGVEQFKQNMMNYSRKNVRFRRRRMNSQKNFEKNCRKVFSSSVFLQKSPPGDVFCVFISLEKLINVKLSVRMTGKN